MSNNKVKFKKSDLKDIGATIFDGGHHSVMVTDPRGRIVNINPKFETTTGFSRKEVIGKKASLLKSGWHDPGYYEGMWKGLKEEGSWGDLIWNRRKNGEVYLQDLNIHSVRSGKGKTKYYISVFNDVTEAMQLEIERNNNMEMLRSQNLELKRDLNQASADVADTTTILSEMTHEMRNSLNCIIGFSEALQMLPEAMKEGGKDEEYIGIIHQAGKHMLEVVNDYLDMAKAKCGDITISKDLIDVPTLVNSLVDMMAGQAKIADIRMDAKIGPDLPVIEGDETRLRQVLLNLLGNALKFTPAGGVVSLQASFDPKQKTVNLEVIDSGIGIDEKDIERVMKPFEQAGEPLSSGKRGTGLGLPLCQSLVNAHGGEFNLESSPGEGTTASIRLPHECLIL